MLILARLRILKSCRLFLKNLKINIPETIIDIPIEKATPLLLLFFQHLSRAKDTIRRKTLEEYAKTMYWGFQNLGATLKLKYFGLCSV
jgi:hypothetical protein